MDNGREYLKSAPQHYQELVNRIVELSGMKHNLYAYETNTTEGFVAHHKNGIPILGYNPDFISHINKKIKWADVALMASEVMYHRNMDLYGKYISNYYNIRTTKIKRPKRLNGDYFVGKVLRHEGATLPEALAILDFFAKFKSDEAREERMCLITDGWRSADEELKEQLQLPMPVSLRKDVSGKELAAILFGLIYYLFKEE